MANPIALLVIVGALAVPTVAQPASDEPEPGQYRGIYECLSAVAREQEKLTTCNGLEARQYLELIAEAGGNLGMRAVSHAEAIELSGWLAAWVYALEERLWHSPGDTPASVMARFAELQRRAIDECIREREELGLELEHIAPCFADVYGPALVEELRW